MIVDLTIPGPLLPWQRGNPHKGRVLSSKEQKAQQNTIRWHWLRAVAPTVLRKPWDPSGRYSVVIEVTWPDRRRRDLDNATKQVLDALTGLAWADDCQVDHIAVTRAAPSKDHPQTVVTVRRIAKAKAAADTRGAK